MRWLASLGLHVAVISAAGAADITGTWIGTLPQRGRTPARDIACKLVQGGSTISGKVYNAAGTSDPITSGTISGDTLKFEIETLEQSGNQINIVRYRFDGRITSDGIDVTRERAAARNAITGTEIPVRREWDSDEEDRQRRFYDFRLTLLVR